MPSRGGNRTREGPLGGGRRTLPPLPFRGRAPLRTRRGRAEKARPMLWKKIGPPAGTRGSGAGRGRRSASPISSRSVGGEPIDTNPGSPGEAPSRALHDLMAAGASGVALGRRKWAFGLFGQGSANDREGGGGGHPVPSFTFSNFRSPLLLSCAQFCSSRRQTHSDPQNRLAR